MMRSVDLHTVWGATDNSHLTAKQLSFRLPTHVAAKINALCEMYPRKTKTEIVGDLLAAALEELEQSLPATRGRQVDQDSEFGAIFEMFGPRVDFRRLANKHFRDLESERGNESPGELYAALRDCERPPE